uniref:Nuclear protein 1 n=1 Tax=Salmo salar TaxID=8030 RepID=B9ELR6_SALSA|nr:Nuclear protein 1 [Salmo salar]
MSNSSTCRKWPMLTAMTLHWGQVGVFYIVFKVSNLNCELALFPGGASRKGRSKKEASDNTNRPNPGGHERKLVEKLQNTEKKAKE